MGFVPYSPLGKGFLTGKIDENAKFDSSDFRSTLPRFTPEALKANQAAHRPARRDCEAQERDSRSDRTRLAAGAKAVDRSNSRHDQAKPSGREHRSALDPSDARRPARHRRRRVEDQGGRCALPGTLGENDWTLSRFPLLLKRRRA
jgi:hypothetical protein